MRDDAGECYSSAEELDLEDDAQITVYDSDQLDTVELTISETRMMRKFDDLDVDHIGAVKKTALLTWLREGENLSSSGSRKVFARWATLLDDSVAFEEFCALYRAVDSAHTYTVWCDLIYTDCSSNLIDSCAPCCLAFLCSLFTGCLSWLCLCAYARIHNHRGDFIAKGLTGEPRSKKRRPRCRDALKRLLCSRGEQGRGSCADDNRACCTPRRVCKPCPETVCARRAREAVAVAAVAAVAVIVAAENESTEEKKAGDVPLTAAERAMLQTFDMLDVEHSGVVTKSALLLWLRQDVRLSASGAGKIFARWGTSLDDSVSFEDFCALYRAVDDAEGYTVWCDLIDDDCRMIAPDTFSSVALACLCSLPTGCLSWLCLVCYVRLHHHRGEFIAKGLTGEPRSKRRYNNALESERTRICRAACRQKCRASCPDECGCCERRRYEKCMRLHPEGEEEEESDPDEKFFADIAKGIY